MQDVQNNLELTIIKNEVAVSNFESVSKRLSTDREKITNMVPVQNEEKIQEKPQKFQVLGKLIDSQLFQILVTTLTIYALFGSDVRVFGFNKYADIYFDAITIVCLIVFSFEIICSCLSKPGYVNSFFFYLDVISTISLLLDIGIFSEAVGLSSQGSATKKSGALLRAGRASRIGTKAGRIVRLVRLIRIVKLYKAATDQPNRTQLLLKKRLQKKIHPNPKLGNQEGQKGNDAQQKIQYHHKKQEEKNQSQSEQQQQEDQDDEPLTESVVSKKLSDNTTKKVIVVILALVIICPFFSISMFATTPYSMDFQCQIMGQMIQTNLTNDLNFLNNTWMNIIAQNEHLGTPIIEFTNPFLNNIFDNYQSADIDEIRGDDQQISQYAMDENIYFNLKNYTDPTLPLAIMAVVNIHSINAITAILSFARTIYICIVLTAGSMIFSKDANDLVLRPIERMIQTVNKISQNPNIAVELKLQKDESSNDKNETIKIENAIIKIGMLLALGFGDAGSEIIGSNMVKGGDVDPMLPGIKKCAIYGFCDIRNFTDATEQLQEDVMLFVNNIGAIVHTMVDRYAGTANKNIGDAFLLVWKMQKEKYTIVNDDVFFNDQRYVEQLADCSLISFMKIQAKLNREPKLLEYRKDERLLKRMPGYKIKIGYGLHLGWGIEGAIGSIFKIDASYLSPNVNMAARLEAGTKQYGVPFLISSELQKYFSPDLKYYTRQIDYVTVKGSIIPIGFYTVDMEVDGLPPSKPDSDYAEFTKEDLAFMLREKKKIIMDQIKELEFQGAEQIQTNKDLKLTMKDFNPQFNELFGQAFQSYLKGDWKLAKSQLAESSKLKPNDGPTQTLLNVMSETNFQCPSDWKGYRELHEK